MIEEDDVSEYTENKVKQIKAKYQNPNQLDKEIDTWLGVEKR